MVSDNRARYHVRLRKVLPGSMLIRLAKEGSFSATAAVGQIELVSDAIGSGII